MARRRTRKATTLRAKLLLAGASVLVACLMAEVAVRVFKYAQEEQNASEWLAVKSREVAEAGPGDPVGLGHLVEPSEHEDIIYQLLPDLDVANYFGGSVQSNSHGFRGPPCTIEKPANTFRIVGLGDSVMFGNGVDNGESFVRVLEDQLNSDVAPGGRRYEVINMAMGGYNTAMEVAHFLRHGLELDPDLVVIDYVGNDFHLPNFLAGRTNFWALDRLFLWEWLERRLGTREWDRFRPLARAPRANGSFANDPKDVPPEYRHMVGPEGYRAAMAKLRGLADEHDFAVVLTSHSGLNADLANENVSIVIQTAEELGFPQVDGSPTLLAYMEEQGLERHEYRGSVLTVSDDDPHPSALSHRLLGEYYAKRLVELGLLE